jgi:hypothetical protein
MQNLLARKIVSAHHAYFQTQVQMPEMCYQEPENDGEFESSMPPSILM